MPTDLREIGEALRTQDNLATAHPLFIVEQRESIWGVDPAYGGEVTWIHDDGGEADAKEAGRLETRHRAAGRFPKGWTRTGRIYRWRFVTACFTRKGCEDYIAADGHNLDSPRIYVASAYRNREWQAVRAFLMEQSPLNREEAP